MELPDAAGLVTVRAVRWLRSGSGQWALQATMPGWKALTDRNPHGGGRWEAGAVEEFHVVPAARVHPIPGQDYRALPRDPTGSLTPHHRPGGP